MKLDLLATEPHFVDHLWPIWQALPEQTRGAMVLPYTLSAHARRLGVPVGQAPRSEAVLVASWGDHKRARLYGYRHLARIEHGIGQSFGTGHPSYAGGQSCEDVGLFLTPNRYSADLWQAAYPQARVEVVGCPKVDALPRYEATEPPTVAVSFHWNGQTVPEAGSAFADFSQQLIGLRNEPYRLIVHSHPKAAPQISRWALRHGLPFEDSFEQVLSRAALYVCDGVSTLYEFAMTGRPVLVLNAAAYRPHAHHGLRFWEAADVGIQVDVTDDLGVAIERALRDTPTQRRRREHALGLVYAHRGDATHRAVRALSRWLRSLTPELQAGEAVA